MDEGAAPVRCRFITVTHDQLRQAFEALLRTKEISVERSDNVLKALRVFKATSADFADCLIERSAAAAAAGCDRTMTFDIGAAKVAGMVLIR